MKRFLPPFLLAFAATVLAPAESRAADHYDAYDGDFVTSDNERHHDIVDVFTFPSADKKRLVMIMNTYNRANALSVFDDKLAYSFRVMTGKTAGQGNEYRFTCRFIEKKSDGVSTPKQVAKCNAFRIVADPRSSTGRKAKSLLERVVDTDVVSPSQDPRFRIFAGRRADAFFGDAGGLGEMLATRKLPANFKAAPTNVGPRNLTAITDDLSIVMEVDFAGLFEEKGTIFRVAAETAYPKVER